MVCWRRGGTADSVPAAAAVATAVLGQWLRLPGALQQHREGFLFQPVLGQQAGGALWAGTLPQLSGFLQDKSDPRDHTTPSVKSLTSSKLQLAYE